MMNTSINLVYGWCLSVSNGVIIQVHLVILVLPLIQTLCVLEHLHTPETAIVFFFTIFSFWHVCAAFYGCKYWQPPLQLHKFRHSHRWRSLYPTCKGNHVATCQRNPWTCLSHLHRVQHSPFRTLDLWKTMTTTLPKLLFETLLMQLSLTFDGFQLSFKHRGPNADLSDFGLLDLPSASSNWDPKYQKQPKHLTMMRSRFLQHNSQPIIKISNSFQLF